MLPPCPPRSRWTGFAKAAGRTCGPTPSAFSRRPVHQQRGGRPRPSVTGTRRRSLTLTACHGPGRRPPRSRRTVCGGGGVCWACLLANLGYRSFGAYWCPGAVAPSTHKKVSLFDVGVHRAWIIAGDFLSSARKAEDSLLTACANKVGMHKFLSVNLTVRRLPPRVANTVVFSEALACPRVPPRWRGTRGSTPTRVGNIALEDTRYLPFARVVHIHGICRLQGWSWRIKAARYSKCSTVEVESSKP